MRVSGAYGRKAGQGVEHIYNDKPGRYDAPIGIQILGISLDGITYVTRLHEWIIEYRLGSAQDRDQFPSLENLSIGRPLGSPIDISPRVNFSNQPPRAKLALEFCQ